jgi:hypothetical protein
MRYFGRLALLGIGLAALALGWSPLWAKEAVPMRVDQPETVNCIGQARDPFRFQIEALR